MLSFYNDELIRIFRKNVDDPQLRRYVIAKMYRKSFLRALRSGEVGYLLKNLSAYLACKWFGRC